MIYIYILRTLKWAGAPPFRRSVRWNDTLGIAGGIGSNDWTPLQALAASHRRKSVSRVNTPWLEVFPVYLILVRFPRHRCVHSAPHQRFDFSESSASQRGLSCKFLYLGKSVYPTASNEYQTFMSAGGFNGQPLAKRSTRSGLLRKGRPNEIKSACPFQSQLRRFPACTRNSP